MFENITTVSIERSEINQELQEELKRKYKQIVVDFSELITSKQLTETRVDLIKLWEYDKL